ncbi:MAG TPA: M50 family metallopeptidase [Dehalococcoidia bacterium]|nr:M50 family metallopeptidase [Dehalococcoidia bacterium]
MDRVVQLLSTVGLFVAVLLVLVMVHELGHFVTAKRAGIKVLEFGFGFPPRLFGLKRGETEYTVNLLPLGGFVKMLGEEDPSDPRSFAAQPAWVRIVVLAAGATMNAVLAIALFSGSLMIPREVVQGQVVIESVAPDSPAERAGIQPGDQVVRVNGRLVTNQGDLSYRIMRHIGDEITLTLKSDRFSSREVTVVPRLNPPPGEGATGIRIALRSAYPGEESYPIWEAIPLGFERTWDMLVITKNDLSRSIAQRVAPPLAGPIGIADMTRQVADTGGPGRLIEFIGLLSINLAIVNILPLPMLDGGRIVFVLVELVRGGRRVAPEKESLVHLAGLVMLLTLVVIISYNDIARMVSGGSLVR